MPRKNKDAIAFGVEHFDKIPDEALVTIDTSMKVSELSRSTINRLFKVGRLEKRKIGKSTRTTAGSLRKVMRGDA